MRIDQFSEEAFNAYLAGFIDGEGHLQAHPHQAGVRLTIANCVPEVLRDIQNRLGFGVIRSQHQREHWRVKYVLVFNNFAEVTEVIQRVLLFLQIKRPEADAILERAVAWQTASAALDERDRQIQAAIASGEKQKEVALRFGLSQQTISRIRRRDCSVPRPLWTPLGAYRQQQAE
jgi:DNA-binding CsgD family transcriptional regulator